MAKRPETKAREKTGIPQEKVDPVEAANQKVANEVARRKRIVRNFPAAPVEEPLEFAKQIFEFGSGEPVRRLTFFDHIDRAPESGGSRQLITNANKYGLIKGNYQSDLIELAPDAIRAVDPQIAPRDQARARIKVAIEDIEVFSKLHERFVGKTLPARAALIDAVVELGSARDAAEEAVDTFIVNLRFVGLLVTLSGAERIVSKDHALDQLPSSGNLSRPVISLESKGAIVTVEHAHYETTCFYITKLGL
ncbi:hypothetical protein [Rhizobium laguerreae]|uniref:hypothetical protein n=1 Tax=Rhizobium laguerreae TaxID=1076926 RepID=UPI001C928006|nr:hypothetical protein [Rhizobium laguerreae]